MNIFTKVCVCDYWYFVQSRAGLVQHLCLWLWFFNVSVFFYCFFAQPRAGLVQHQPRQRGRLEEWGDHQCNQGSKQSCNFNSTLMSETIVMAITYILSLWDAHEIEHIIVTLSKWSPTRRSWSTGWRSRAGVRRRRCSVIMLSQVCDADQWLSQSSLPRSYSSTFFYCFLSDCVIRSGDAAGLPLCYEDCVALRQQVRFPILDQPYICSETAG